MTPEEACEVLGISLDDDLTVEVLENKYRAKLAECGDSREKRIKVNAACEVLVNLLAESEEEDTYPEEESGQQKSTEKHEGLFMKLAMLMAGVFLLSLGGVMYFVYKIHTDNISPKSEMVQNQDYDRLLHEVEELRRKQGEMQRQQEETQQTPPQQNNMADYSELVEMLQKGMVYIEAHKASSVSTGSGFLVSGNGDILTNYHEYVLQQHHMTANQLKHLSRILMLRRI